MTLHIRGGSRPALSWRTAVWLEAGRYRFEGLARTAGVKPSVVDKKHGASLGVAGQNPSGAKSLTADTEWTKLEAEFEVPVQEAAIELLCVLRADAGDAWFDVDSLQLVRLDSKGD